MIFNTIKYLFLIAISLIISNSYSFANESVLKSTETRVKAKICVINEKNLSKSNPVVITTSACPDSRYKITRYKKVPGQVKHYLKRKFCYNKNSDKIFIRAKKCKDSEVVLKYKYINETDIFYIEGKETLTAKKEINQKYEIIKTYDKPIKINICLNDAGNLKLVLGPCPDITYKIIKYKDIPPDFKNIVKRNICYNNISHKISTRQKACKKNDNEIGVKYTNINNNDIFYYEDREKSPNF